MKKILYFLSFLLLLASCSGKKDDKTISIGYINWDDGIALTYLTEVILEQQGYHVVLKNADPAPIYATMARGKVDLLMDAWLPATQADYMKHQLYLQPIITQYFIDNKSEIWLLFLIAHSKR